jgi:hypothetical protein
LHFGHLAEPGVKNIRKSTLQVMHSKMAVAVSFAADFGRGALSSLERLFLHVEHRPLTNETIFPQ